MQKSKIFSIEEFSTYDGPGIRMTVFLKGCPLSCEWCHNPEGQSFEAEYLRSPNGCISCGACIEASKKLYHKSILTEASISACPRGLVRLAGEEYTSEQLVGVINKNIAILNASGGGVTFSGGEPLAHSDFVCECLDMLCGKTHRAVQTSGYCENHKFLDVASRCELILYDLKLIDDTMHKRHTGVSNEKIIENYKALSRLDTTVITRIPLIPTVNDTRENIEATARLMRECGREYIELLPYNKLAGGKYALCGREYKPSFDESMEVEPHIDIFNKYGIEVKIL